MAAELMATVQALPPVGHPIWYVAVFCFGACVGSYLNVCIYRLPEDRSTVHPSSHCFSCGKPIKWYDNIPMLSWLLLRGKCRNCGTAFSGRYALVELLTALLFVAVWWKYHPSPAVAGVYMAVVAALVMGSVIDIDHRFLPDRVTIGGILAGPVLSLLVPALHDHPAGVYRFRWETDLPSLADSLVGLACGYWLISLITAVAVMAIAALQRVGPGEAHRSGGGGHGLRRLQAAGGGGGAVRMEGGGVDAVRGIVPGGGIRDGHDPDGQARAGAADSVRAVSGGGGVVVDLRRKRPVLGLFRAFVPAEADVSGPGNIVLIGFMGTGKSTVGRELASHLHREFVDMDHEIEVRAGRRIHEIFEAEGERAFRDLETAVARSLAARENLVIACGGGVVLRAENLEALSSTGTLICLRADPEAVLARVGHQTDRPLLEVEDKLARIRELHAARKPLYDAIPLQIDTVGKPPEAVAADVLRALLPAPG